MPEQQTPQWIESAAHPPPARRAATDEKSETSVEGENGFVPTPTPAPTSEAAAAHEKGGVNASPSASSGDALTPLPEAKAAGEMDSTQQGSDGTLEELTLPSLIQAPEPLPAGSVLGTAGRVQIVEHVQTRGRSNQYVARWQGEDGAQVDVELREGPTDDAGLQRESEIRAAVQYAMLPQLYQTWEENERRYLALEQHSGQTLAQTLADGVPPAEALSLVLQLVQVARRVHQAGWALLGLSPADVVLGQPLHLAYLRHARRLGEPQTQSLHIPGYSAPELVAGVPVTGREDVYTLGALLYHALTGHPLPEGGDEGVDLSATIRLPGGPQLLADALAPADERIDIDTLYQRLLSLKRRHAETALSLAVASATTVGLNPTRHVNEDSCAFAQWSQSGADEAVDVSLLCVADGMGGMEAGEIASQTAVNVVMRGADSMFWPAAADAPAGAGRRLDPVRLIREAATAVHAAAQGRELGTTATVVAVHGKELTLGHVGDTRAYLFREGALARLTADHSLVAAMVASGVLTPEEAEGHPDSNKVLRSLGSQRELPDGYVDDLQAAYGQPILTLTEHDWLLLCSDGVWGSVDDGAILTILKDAADHHAAARTLIESALAAGAPDNATAIVAQCRTRSML